jgi:hypothetical protein
MISPTQGRSAVSIQNPPHCLVHGPTKEDVDILNAISPSQIHPEQEHQMGESIKGGAYHEQRRSLETG